jgi:hypothetical protein
MDLDSCAECLLRTHNFIQYNRWYIQLLVPEQVIMRVFDLVSSRTIKDI